MKFDWKNNLIIALIVLIPAVAFTATKISELTPDADPTADDLLVIVNDPGGTPATRSATVANVAKGMTSTNLTDTADILYETELDTEAELEAQLTDVTNVIVSTEIDTFAELNALVADETLVNTNDAQTLTNKTIDADNNTISNIDTGEIKAATLVIESEGIAANDNDTTIPTSAAVKDYVDTNDADTQLTDEQVEDIVGAMVTTTNTETFITVTYQDTTGDIDFVVPVLDEDTMSSNSATDLATQQSIKAYVDANAGGSIPYDTVANLPGSPSSGDLAGVTDGNADDDCTTGGGSTYNLCQYTGAAWVVVGDGTTASGADAVSVDSSAVTDPDFVSTGDIDFVDTSNTITANINAGVVDFADIKYDNTLAGNPALAVDECWFFADSSGGGFICEGSTADTSEQLYRFPDVNGSDTTRYIMTDDTSITSVDDTTLTVNAGALRRAALTGDVTASAGSNTTAIGAGVIVNADVNASAAIALSKLATSTSAQLRTLLSDESGTGAAIFAGGDIAAATATTPSANDNDTSVATTAYVQTELTAYASDSKTLTNTNFDANGTGNSIINIESADIAADTITHADIADEDQADTKCFYIEDPTAADDLQSIWANKTANDFLITGIWAESDQTVSFDLQVDDGTPADVNGTDISPAAGEAEDTTLSGDTTVAAGEELDLVITSVSGNPTWVSICFTGNWVD